MEMGNAGCGFSLVLVMGEMNVAFERGMHLVLAAGWTELAAWWSCVCWFGWLCAGLVLAACCAYPFLSNFVFTAILLLFTFKSWLLFPAGFPIAR